MPRIAEARAAAEPSSPEQVARQHRILRAAAALAAEKGPERVQMHEVARDAGVAIGTLYRYFPSKTHLFTALLAEQVERFDESLGEPSGEEEPEEAVAGVLAAASRELLRRPLLATAMLQSFNTANAATVTDVARIDRTFDSIILRTLGIGEPTAKDLSLIRLLQQLWYGVLQSSLNGRISLPDAEADITMACRLLLAPRSNAHPQP